MATDGGGVPRELGAAALPTTMYHPDRVVLPPPPMAASAGLADSLTGAGAYVLHMSPGAIAAESDTPATDEAPEAKSPVPHRQVTYRAQLSLRVANAEESRRKIESLIQEAEGFLSNTTLSQVIFRVPPGAFEPTMAALEKLGAVEAREISVDDVTAEYTDLQIRLEVSETSRQRLMDLLKSQTELKHVLEAEADIRRLTEEIERIKGGLRVLQDRIDWATITVTLSENAPVAAVRPRRPGTVHPWIVATGLGQTLAAPPPGAPVHGGRVLARFFRGPDFRLGTGGRSPLPEEFLPLLYDEDRVLGSTPEDSRLRARVVRTQTADSGSRLGRRSVQEAPLDFWSKALRHELAENRGHEILAEDSFSVSDSNLKAAVLRARAEHEGAQWLYDVWLIQDPARPGRLLVVEYARDAAADKARLAAIEASVRGVRLG